MTPPISVANYVSQFGQTGAAIQAAIKAATAHKMSMPPRQGAAGPVYVGGMPRVEIPFGIYQLDVPITAPTYIDLVGDNCLLQPTAKFPAGGYAITGDAVWHARFSGLQFNGVSGFKLANNDLDHGLLLIERCQFHGGAEAINVDCQSSMITFRDNHFNNCVSVLTINGGDVVTIEGGWISQAAFNQNRQASITIVKTSSYQTFTMRSVLGCPGVVLNGATETAWINNFGGTVICDDCRFGGEAGSKTIVNNFKQAESIYPIHAQAIIIQNSRCFQVDGGPNACAVRLFAVPNQIVIRNNSGFIASRAIGWSSSVSPPAVITSALNSCPSQLINISVEGNQQIESLSPFVPIELIPFFPAMSPASILTATLPSLTTTSR